MYSATIVPHLNYFSIAGASFELEKICPGFGFEIYTTFYSKNGDESDWILPEHFAERQYKRILADYSILERMYALWQKRQKEYYAYVNSFSSRAITDLKKDYEEFTDVYLSLFTPSLLVEYFYTGTEYMVSLLLEKYPLLQTQIREAMAPMYGTFLGEEKLSLLLIARQLKSSNPKTLQELQKENPSIYRLVVEHQKNFFWIQNNYKYTEPIQLTVFFENARIESKRTIEEIEKEIFALLHQEKMLKQKREELNLKLDPDSQKLLHWISLIGYWHDQRKRATLIACHYLNLFLHKTSEKTGIKFEILQFTTPSELLDLLDGKSVPIEEWRQRMKGCVQIGNKDQRFWTLSGSVYEQLRERLMPKANLENIQSLQGITACAGEAKGIARVVKKPSDPFNEGEILVTSMTRPEFVPLMKKARGIVTNEGGITSHAAIISRELNIPCIIGTRIATQVIKDGTLIELRTNHGIVRIFS